MRFYLKLISFENCRLYLLVSTNYEVCWWYDYNLEFWKQVSINNGYIFDNAFGLCEK